MNMPTDRLEALFGFFAFYVALPTVFIPLTFALTATLKGQYRQALDNPALKALTTPIFRFEKEFFYYNDAFAECVVWTAVLGMLGIGAVYWVFIANGASDAGGSAAAWCVQAGVGRGGMLVLLAGAWAVAHRYMFKSHKDLYSNTVPNVGGLWRALVGCVILLPRAESGSARRRYRPIVLLEVANLGLVLWLVTIYAFRGALDHANLGFLVHALLVLLVWWELYVAWAPFSFLRSWETVPYNEGLGRDFLKDPAAKQLATYRKFMYQYEEDDIFRAGKQEMAAMLDKIRPQIKGGHVGLKEWREAALKAMATSGEPCLVVYAGCGYGGLAEAVETFAKELLKLGEKVGDVRLLLIDSVTVPRIKGLCEQGVDREKLERLRERCQLGNYDCSATDIFTWAGEQDSVPKKVPPLIMLLNTTYGTLFRADASGSGIRPAGSATLADDLDKAQRNAVRWLVGTLTKKYEAAGFGLLVHSKRIGARSPSGFPYSRTAWIPLLGTSEERGLYLLGRFDDQRRHGDSGPTSPEMMFCRWLDSARFAEDMRGTEAKVCGSVVLPDVRDQKHSRFVWSGAWFEGKANATGCRVETGAHCEVASRGGGGVAGDLPEGAAVPGTAGGPGGLERD